MPGSMNNMPAVCLLVELELVRELDLGRQPANFILSSVKIFAGSPAYDCKFRLV